MANTKAIPSNCNHVVVMYKGKKLIENVDEVGGLTHSRRCYSPVELRKNKQGSEERMTIKKPVTKEEAKEFLKKMKLPEYSVVELLKKMPP